MPKKKFLISLIVLLIVAVILLVRFFQTKEPSYNFVVAQKGDLVQQVSVIGRVEPAKSVDLAFEKSGRVAKVEVRIGDQVNSGQTLITLDSEDLAAQLAQYQAAWESAQAGLAQYQAAWETQRAKLDELRAGAKPEEVQVSETKVANAEKSLADAKTNLEDVKSKTEIDLVNLYDDIKDILDDAYTKAAAALDQQIDDLFSNDDSEDPDLTFSTSNSQAKIDVESQRVSIGRTLKSLKSEIDNPNLFSVPLKQDDLDKLLVRGENYLTAIREFLDRLNDAVNGAINLSSTTVGIYKGNINTARTNINTAISNVNAQEQLIAGQKVTNQNNINTAQAQINAAQNALVLAQDELILKKSGATGEQIKAQESQVKQAELNVDSQKAQVKQAKAAVENIQSQLAKTILKTPIDGVVAKQEAKVGEIASPNIAVVSVISQADFEVKANAPEVDIAKIKVGNLAEITLDAYSSDDLFKAQVVSINPAETIIEGVATYEITLNFLEKDQRIKSGMTADIDVLTEEKKDVLVVPSRAIANKDGGKFAKILIQSPDKEEKVLEVAVETGLRSSDGRIEIIKGIEPGDRVIMP